MSTRWKTPQRPKLRRFCDFVSINNSSYSNDMSFILDYECMAVVQRVVFFSEVGEFPTVYGWSVGRFVVAGAAARCWYYTICDHIFSHAHLLNTHCNRFFNVYNSHLACRTSSSWLFHPISLCQPTMVSYRKVCCKLQHRRTFAPLSTCHNWYNYYFSCNAEWMMNTRTTSFFLPFFHSFWCSF